MNGRVDASAGHGVPFVGHSAAALADLGSCRSCHGADYGGGWAPSHGTLPTSLAHVDGVTAVPGYAGGGGSCAVQCHGATSPAWTSTAGIACGACHTTAPTSGLHQYHLVGLGSRSVSCAVCHPGYGPGAVNLATHVDGTFQAFIQANPDGDYPTRERAFSTSTVKQDWGLDSESCEACHL